MIEARRLTVTYPDGTRAVDGVDFAAPPGRLVVVAGPNGGGKTSLLLALSGLAPHVVEARVEGEVRVYGVDPRVEPWKAWRLVQATVQDPRAQVLAPTVLLEAALSLFLRGAPPQEALQAARRALEEAHAAHLADRPTHRLSMGELSRVALAGAISPRPRHLLLDEPTSHLDPEAAEAVTGLLRGLAVRGAGVVAASHDPRLWEAADECVTLDRGRVREGCPRAPAAPRPAPPRRPQGRVSLRLMGVWARYPGAREPALRGVDLEAREGEMVALVGPNGGGKTSILYAAAGLLPPEKGSVWRLHTPALLPPDPLLVFSRGRLRDELERLASPRVPGWAQGLLDKPLLRASGGERRLAAIALLAASGRRLLLLDEPTDWLDPWNKQAVLEALRSLAGQGYTILYSTHDPAAAQAADRAYRVEEGRAEPE